MYRAVSLYFLKYNISLKGDISDILEGCKITFDGSSILLNGKAVNHEIRSHEVNEWVSHVSTLPEVRRRMVAYQRAFGMHKGIVMDGRDIGTVVFPDAELKFFMTCNINVRAERRRKEMAGKGISKDIEVIRKNLLDRDTTDSSRKDSPLRKAKDAFELDTTNLTLEEQVNIVVQKAKKIINEN